MIYRRDYSKACIHKSFAHSSGSTEQIDNLWHHVITQLLFPPLLLFEIIDLCWKLHTRPPHGWQILAANQIVRAVTTTSGHLSSLLNSQNPPEMSSDRIEINAVESIFYNTLLNCF